MWSSRKRGPSPRAHRRPRPAAPPSRPRARPSRRRPRRGSRSSRPADGCRAAPAPARIDVPIAYRLFSQRKSTGSCQSAARLSDSWNSPSATAPSPKKQAVTRCALLQLVGEREPDRDRQAPADDRVAAVEAARDVEEVHRAAATATAAVGLAEHLGHQRPRRHTARQRLPVLAVGRDDPRRRA